MAKTGARGLPDLARMTMLGGRGDASQGLALVADPQRARPCARAGKNFTHDVCHRKDIGRG